MKQKKEEKKEKNQKKDRRLISPFLLFVAELVVFVGVLEKVFRAVRNWIREGQAK